LNERQKILQKVLNNPKNVRFLEVKSIVEAFGFKLSRISGSHHIFTHSNLSEIVNLQNVNGRAKSYQVKQFLRLVERYNLELNEK
jgi:predicted RNA binding protein YcfA (HicA-like mRNA interferase family)